MAYFRKTKSLYSSTTNSFSTGESETITPSSVTGLPTDTELVLTFDRSVAGKLERIKGTISGSNFVISSGGRGYDGTAEGSHTSPVVEYMPNAADINETVTGILVQHAQTGVHTSALVTTLKASGAVVNTGTSDTTIVTPKAIADSYLGGATSNLQTQITSLNSGWIPAGTFTYASTDAPTYVITVASGAASIYNVGDRIKLTDTTVKYFIITAVADTSLTVYGGTDYTLSGGAITLPYYSHSKAPLGFNTSPLKWFVQKTDTTEAQQLNPANGTWYNLGSISITVPIGLWKINYKVATQSGISNQQATLSTANNSESNSDFTTGVLAGTSSPSYIEQTILLASKTVMYLNSKVTSDGGTSYIDFRGDVVKTIINAVCAYL